MRLLLGERLRSLLFLCSVMADACLLGVRGPVFWAWYSDPACDVGWLAMWAGLRIGFAWAVALHGMLARGPGLGEVQDVGELCVVFREYLDG